MEYQNVPTFLWLLRISTGGVPKNATFRTAGQSAAFRSAGQSLVTRAEIDQRLLIDSNSESAFFGIPRTFIDI